MTAAALRAQMTPIVPNMYLGRSILISWYLNSRKFEAVPALHKNGGLFEVVESGPLGSNGRRAAASTGKCEKREISGRIALSRLPGSR
jgi:hypothetical protein